ncbi:uncharacterized protein BDZ83DRAFT_305478 [Colletotrichum acutatum]|uniref:Uncharacterized protein n=1 Tax=Glomerella acutata TaxID=27357 RepID=A0AAD8XGG1_GLOAC|nr:uncharacterized protein BDZ83DRAFT_305478 [Colletotrichum acutatum]KAK1725341.1 hypothetical protein BDZ83DRAFT_305478 [Colletotrichum acutatum]
MRFSSTSIGLDFGVGQRKINIVIMCLSLNMASGMLVVCACASLRIWEHIVSHRSVPSPSKFWLWISCLPPLLLFFLYTLGSGNTGCDLRRLFFEGYMSFA